MNITIDIETIPAQDPSVKADILREMQPPGNLSKADTIALWHIEKKPEAAEEAWRKTSFDGALGHICVIGYAFDDEDPIALYGHDYPHNESDMLFQFFRAIDEKIALHPNVRPTFIGHNVIDFDLRFIFQRAVMCGIKPSIHIPFNARPWDDGVYDTMTRWAGTKDRVKLDKLARALGVGGKGDMDGSKVWDAVNEGRIAEVASYCKNDVAMTREVHRRMTFAPARVSVLDGIDGLPF